MPYCGTADQNRGKRVAVGVRIVLQDADDARQREPRLVERLVFIDGVASRPRPPGGKLNVSVLGAGSRFAPPLTVLPESSTWKVKAGVRAAGRRREHEVSRRHVRHGDELARVDRRAAECQAARSGKGGDLDLQ